MNAQETPKGTKMMWDASVNAICTRAHGTGFTATRAAIDAAISRTLSRSAGMLLGRSTRRIPGIPAFTWGSSGEGDPDLPKRDPWNKACRTGVLLSRGGRMALRIEDYGLIGDLHTAVLVGTNGSIDWACFPRFDSDACFAALIGTEHDGFWEIV